jgi:hypothetical protein
VRNGYGAATSLIGSAIVAAAWISVVGAQSRRARMRPASSTLHAMGIVWPRIEPYSIDLLRGRP